MKKAPILRSFFSSMAACLLGKVITFRKIGRLFKILAAQVRNINGSVRVKGVINKALAEKAINVIIEEGEYPMVKESGRAMVSEGGQAMVEVTGNAIAQEGEQVLLEDG